MKKFNLVIAALLVLSVSIFAVDVTPSATVSGEASVTFTYDLDASTLNIVNAASADLTVSLIASTSVEEGEGDVVGHITISGIALEIGAIDEGTGTGVVRTNGDADSLAVDAEIYLMGPTLVLDITTVGNSIDFADGPGFDNQRVIAADPALAETSADVNSDTAPTGQVSLVYDTEMFDVRVHVADDDAAAGNGFDFGLVVGLAPVDGLTVDAGVVYDASGTLGFGGKVGYTVTDLATVSVGVDANDAGDLEVAAALGLTVAGLAADVEFGTDTTASDLEVKLDASGLVEMLTLVVNVEFADLSDLGISAELGLDVAPLTPYVHFDYYEVATGLKVGAGIAVIENVDLDVNYTNADLENISGEINFSATISY